MVCIIWREVLHPGNVARRALEMQVDREVRKALKDSEDGVFVDLHVVLFDLLGGVHQDLYNLTILDSLCNLKSG